MAMTMMAMVAMAMDHPVCLGLINSYPGMF